MVSVSNNQPIIIRTERGLTISGTRITLYDVIGLNASKLSWQKIIFVRESFSENIILKTLKCDGINPVKIEL
ncbi:hypothetical protein [Microcoleus asticus]|uniref:Uncharacterized protein n=1 Tax=Microcoleus asticus IPMA8 TaxID=2563858 RepID=A0ABX2D5P7_9CYAN|nr:hypothetical protein [Microcoleus asticus IPMA8]